jgi:transcriptional regulator with XRE-family HTH domain
MPQRRDAATQDLNQRIQRAFGERLARARAGGPKPLLQQDLANRLRLSRTSISNIERGSQNVFLVQIYLAAQILGIDAKDLLPTMDEIFPPTPMTAAPDDPLPADAAQSALHVVQRIERRFAKGQGKATRDRNRESA